MTETDWWRRFAETAMDLPITRDDLDELVHFLEAAGYFERHGVIRPTDPAQTARSMWRLRYLAPRRARQPASTALSAVDRAGPEDNLRRAPAVGCDAAVDNPGAVSGAWWPVEEDDYWRHFETEYAASGVGSLEGTCRRVRSAIGRRLLTRLRSAWPAEITEDPVRFAHAVARMDAYR